MDVEIINDSEIDSRIRIHPCENCKEPKLTELDLRNHLLTCKNEEQENSLEVSGSCQVNLKIGKSKGNVSKVFECKKCERKFKRNILFFLVTS